MTEMTARIVWRSAAQGGRQTPPSGPRYISPVRFEGIPDTQDSWSLVVEPVGGSPNSTEWFATVRFLVAEAPRELLREGARFELFEGKRCVAVGTVSSAMVPSASHVGSPTPHEICR
jgi:hypothetical protein